MCLCVRESMYAGDEDIIERKRERERERERAREKERGREKE